MTLKPHEYAGRFKPSILRVTVKTIEGDLRTGTAFHIGRGYLVTARHVIEECSIEAIAGDHVPRGGLKVSRIITPPDERIDLALLETDFSLDYYMEKVTIMVGEEERGKVDHIVLGGHLDEWVGEEFLLSDAYLFGYPPIPRSADAVMVAVKTQVNAIVDRYDGPHPHFVISAIPRGGFSGGPVFSEWGFLLGVMTESLYMGGKDSELGFAAVLCIQPLLDLIHENGIDCGKNSEIIKTLYGD